MGLLSILGETFSYEESKKLFKEIKENGIIQFLKLYQKFHGSKLKMPPVLWGDEIEFHILNFDHEKKEIKLQCDIDYVYKKFSDLNEKQGQEFQIQPEYGAWMLETVPTEPFKYCCDLVPVIKNMSLRHSVIQSLLENNDTIFSIPVFPLLGIPNSHLKKPNLDSPVKEKKNHESQENSNSNGDKNHYEEEKSGGMKNGVTKKISEEIYAKNPYSHSIFINDEIINSHPRFPALTRNIRQRRKEKICIKMPLFIDENTKTEKTEEEPYPGFIYMDAMVFGMGNCCLQVTFSTKDIESARYFYDQLSIIAPLILPLTAGSPIFKGKLANTDARWQSIVQAVDDRTPEEIDPSNPHYIPRSRYDCISYFISSRENNYPEYNDVPFPLNKEIMDFVKLKEKEFNVEIDDNLLRHLGFLYLRDPLVIFKGESKDHQMSTSDFENIQSTNWNSVRFKPPPNLNSSVNWRVEFRPMEVQITHEENALFSFLVLRILRMLSFEDFNLNFYIPMSLVHKNFERAVQRNALIEQKFFVRKNVFDKGKPEIIEISLFEFFNGNKDFLGLKAILAKFNEFFEITYKSMNLPKEYQQKCQKQNEKIFQYINDKTTGKKLSLASWIRKFVSSHPMYKKDSIISKDIAYDLLKAINDISNHKVYDYNFDCGLDDNEK